MIPDDDPPTLGQRVQRIGRRLFLILIGLVVSTFLASMAAEFARTGHDVTASTLAVLAYVITILALGILFS